jgi:hypothetical protein
MHETRIRTALTSVANCATPSRDSYLETVLRRFTTPEKIGGNDGAHGMISIPIVPQLWVLPELVIDPVAVATDGPK